jgi:hypothetical protein
MSTTPATSKTIPTTLGIPLLLLLCCYRPLLRFALRH